MLPLRVLTLNTQLLPLIAGFLDGTISVPGLLIGLLPGTVSDSKDQANRVADALLAIPPGERPDVVTLNEVFSEDGRAVLRKRLKATWPHVTSIFNELDFEEDSGLIAFSRTPFLKLDNGLQHRVSFFDHDDDDDSWASKAVALVQIGEVANPVTIVFTHLQASYTSESEYSATRRKQLDQAIELIAFQLGPAREDWKNVILCGDLNVRGDSGKTSTEYADVFQSGAHEFGQLLADGWAAMRPAGVVAGFDEGYSQRDRGTQALQRLDYHCTLKRLMDLQLTPHHIRTLARNASDHFAVQALYQFNDLHAQPLSALNVDSVIVPPVAPPTPVASLVREVNIDIRWDGGLCWLFLPRPGTYTFHRDVDLQFDVFALSNVSDPLQRLDQLSVTELPPAVASEYRQRGGDVMGRGDTFMCREPLLIATRTRSPVPYHSTMFVLEHRGDSPATAIRLPPNTEVAVPFPPGQLLGADDICWFRIDTPPTLVSSARSEQVVLRNPTGIGAQLARTDLGESTLGKTSGSGGTLELEVPTVGGESFFLRVHRASDTAVGHSISWTTPVCFLRLDLPLGIHVDDETGPGAAGSDEPELVVTIDSDPAPLVETSWDDADTGEDWPDLDQTFRAAAVARGWTSRSIGFSGGLSLTLDDPDGPLGAAHGIKNHDVPVLSAGTLSQQTRLTLTVPDTWGDGTYTFYCTITRDP